MDSSPVNLSQVYNEEENENVPYSIREEILEKVMCEIDIIYSKQKVVQFVVNCAYSAIINLISTFFYYHSSPPDVDRNWVSDIPNQPSEPDSWAARNVPVRCRTPLPSQRVMKSESTGTCYCDLPSTNCNCFDVGNEAIEKLKDLSFENIEKLSILENTTKISEITLLENFENDQENGKQAELQFEHEEKQNSLSSTEIEVREGLSKGFLPKKRFVLPKLTIELPSKPNVTNNPQKIVELPSIRVESKFETIQNDYPIKKKENRKISRVGF